MPGGLGELDSTGLSGSEIRFRGEDVDIAGGESTGVTGRRHCRDTIVESDGHAEISYTRSGIKALVAEVSARRITSAAERCWHRVGRVIGCLAALEVETQNGQRGSFRLARQRWRRS